MSWRRRGARALPDLQLERETSTPISQTQEMLEFCAEHGITADVEIIPAQAINEAYERVPASDVRHRFVIDAAALF
ncbi:hypothetical protein KDL01_13340 [Actinospica durhamensis]|uniref:Alcohol dehydrogenase n=1 Tax=Actinospica durhamensis TaxID=1508375 RepID=A0A941IRT8_9ACTN|nr:hypothetical protein [Actinospica durhamensis]